MGRLRVAPAGQTGRRNWLGLPAGTVRPALVADALRRAVAAGWRPEQAGAAFALPEAA
ncbi:hypothetical protein [Dactylosporangium sp. NPDC051484]|uniref:hypothetical protein n=1 Tax=Dactylosporangium sp. NPDC051484 TaxID=3154942 RepID=UPI003450E7DF